jgi:hypothetical protein
VLTSSITGIRQFSASEDCDGEAAGEEVDGVAPPEEQAIARIASNTTDRLMSS